MARPLSPLTLILVLALSASGCAVLGVGAAAVGGCALLDRNQDSVVTQEELSAGLFDAWDTNDDGRLSEAEYNAGVNSRAAYADWPDASSDWDSDDDGSLSQAEFSEGVAERGDSAGWADRQCDELGL